MPIHSLELFQSGAGYRYSIDSFILADFVSPAEESRIIDFGTGNGVIPLMMTCKTRSKIIGLEIQKSLLQYARNNIVRNNLENQISLIQGDIRYSRSFLKNDFFDIVVSNPPYRKLNSGRLNPNTEKAIARHEILLTMPQLLENAFNLLCDKGKLVMIYLPERYDELVRTMADNGLAPKKVRFVHSTEKSGPKMFLIEGIKREKNYLNVPFKRGNEVLSLGPLYIYDNQGNYTLEMQKIYDSFNYNCGTDGDRKIR